MKWMNRKKFAVVSLTVITVACLLPNVYAGPSVTVVNTPNTIVANTETNPVPVVLTSTLSVSTTTNEPLLVRDVEGPGFRSPFAVFDTVKFGNGSEDAIITFTFTGAIPKGKMLVIENISISAILGTGETAMGHFLNGQLEQLLVTYHQGQSVRGEELFVANQPVHLYLHPGIDDFNLTIDVARSATNNSTDILKASANGYLINAP